MEAAGATVNGAQIARLTGASPGTVRGRRRQPGFPAPAGNAGTGARYDRAQVAQWLAGAGRWELSPGPRVWREVSHQARGTSLGEAVHAAARTVAARHAGQAPPPGVPGSLAWLLGRAVDEAGAPAVLGDLADRYAAAAGMPLTPARVTDFMVALAGAGPGATVLDPACGTGELPAAALAAGAGRVLAQDADGAAAALARARLLPGDGQHAVVVTRDALAADAFAGVTADAVLGRPPVPAGRPGTATYWARYALARLKPGGKAVLALPPSAAVATGGDAARGQLLRQGLLRAVIALPGAVAPLHLWVLQQPDGPAEPDPLALFVEAVLEDGTGVGDATPAAAGTMPAASWRAFRRSAEIAVDSPRRRGQRAVSSGGGRNARWCVTHVSDLLDDTPQPGGQGPGEAADLTPSRARARFSARQAERGSEAARPGPHGHPRADRAAPAQPGHRGGHRDPGAPGLAGRREAAARGGRGAAA